MDGLKIRQHPTCQRGTADVLAFTVSEVFEHLRVYLCPSTVVFFSFVSDGCMAQRGRCPGGRPSVSANKRVQHAYYSVLKWQLYKPSMNTEYDQQSPRECRYLYWRVQ